jgi:serine acetyltransferase
MDGLQGSSARLYHHLARSNGLHARAVRRVRRSFDRFSIPTPKAVVSPLLFGYVAARSVYYFCKRVFFCQPLFAAYCRRHGRGVRTGSFLPWVQGKGDIILGNDVTVDGECTITFAARFSDRPTLVVGDGTWLGHDLDFTIGRRITIGNDCNISGASRIFDSPGHPLDAKERRAHLPPPAEKVRPVTIGNDVWIAKHCLIFPGVSIGDGAIVAAGSVVRADVRPYTLVAGNPAQEIRSLRPPAADRPDRPPTEAGPPAHPGTP